MGGGGGGVNGVRSSDRSEPLNGETNVTHTYKHWVKV